MEHEPVKSPRELGLAGPIHACRCGLTFSTADLLQFHCDLAFYQSIQVDPDSSLFHAWVTYEDIYRVKDRTLIDELACWSDLDAQLRAIRDQER